ncbi:hypothetical protein EBAPG3_002000 [Nitrosospira lacus]|uniref:Chemotaxis protein n=1 Tax=Nitrosospira lacus TaxID=1288494 RepID=A0A1W6SLF3_9PROT|nr:hypothetical protein [Nitrosospira lacus]ARO86648.1 hypothetical protein EBAPG3_002000 [Nitrosospira lacus]
MLILERWLPIFLVLVALLVSVFSAYIVTQRTLTGLESVLLQSFTLIAGWVGSFFFGRQSAKDAARAIIKPHARSAFRRLISLYESLSRVATEIENSHSTGGTKNGEITLAKLEAIVIEQLATADHALEDWSDIVPDDVAELRAKVRQSER